MINLPLHHALPGVGRVVRRCAVAILRCDGFVVVCGARVFFVGLADAASYAMQSGFVLNEVLGMVLLGSPGCNQLTVVLWLKGRPILLVGNIPHRSAGDLAEGPGGNARVEPSVVM